MPGHGLNPTPRRGASTPQTTVLDLADSSIFETLTGVEIAVYLRLIAAAYHRGKRTVALTNPQLHRGRSSSNVTAALNGLERMGLIRISDPGTLRRTIEVLS